MSEKNPEMRETAARICRDYLHGVWKHITAENIILKRIRFVRFFYGEYRSYKVPISDKACV